MPALFVGHGSPMNAIEDNAFTRGWQAAAQSIAKPKAILCISAHWETRGVGVCSATQPETIHDFGGFPQALFDVRYPAPGDPALAQRVAAIVKSVQIQTTTQWGLDHGAWSVLRVMYPDADVPVVQLSLDTSKPGPFHLALARELAALRDEGVLIVGSGNIVHNLGVLKRSGDRSPYDWAQRFNEHVRTHLLARDHPSLVHYEMLGDAARHSIPTPEHYLPLLYVIALQGADEAVSIVTEGIESGSISMLSVLVGG